MTTAGQTEKMSPEEHLTKACEALDRLKGWTERHPGSEGTVELTTSLSAFASAHLLAAQVKMELNKDPYGDPRPWNRS